MLEYWTQRLRGAPAVRTYPQRGILLYWENGREIEVGCEMTGPNRYEIDPSTIISWNDRRSEFVPEAERLRIARSPATAADVQWGMKVSIKL